MRDVLLMSSRAQSQLICISIKLPFICRIACRLLQNLLHVNFCNFLRIAYSCNVAFRVVVFHVFELLSVSSSSFYLHGLCICKLLLAHWCHGVMLSGMLNGMPRHWSNDMRCNMQKGHSRKHACFTCAFMRACGGYTLIRLSCGIVSAVVRYGNSFLCRSLLAFDA